MQDPKLLTNADHLRAMRAHIDAMSQEQIDACAYLFGYPVGASRVWTREQMIAEYERTLIAQDFFARGKEVSRE